MADRALIFATMKKTILAIAVLLPLAMTAQEEAKTFKPSMKLKTLSDSVSYAIGISEYQGMSTQLGEIVNFEAVIAGLKDAQKEKPGFTQEEMQTVFQKLQAEQQRLYEAKLQENIEAGKKFLAENKKNKGVVETESGLQYKVNKEGTGKKPTLESTITCHYTGKLLDGTKFDSSFDRDKPLTVPLAQLIKGWGEGLQLMKEGANYTFYIPSELAYGNQQAGIIPPGATIVFDVELISVEETPQTQQPATLKIEK